MEAWRGKKGSEDGVCGRIDFKSHDSAERQLFKLLIRCAYKPYMALPGLIFGDGPVGLQLPLAHLRSTSPVSPATPVKGTFAMSTYYLED
jgi:hypothetical protein